MPFYAGRYISALSLGTWQLAKPLLADGHEVTLVLFESQSEDRPRPDEDFIRENYPNLHLASLPPMTPQNRNQVLEHVNTIFERVNPDGVITASTPIASMAAMELPPERPLWVDVHGAIMPELQAKAATMYHPELLTRVYRLYYRMLRRGDRFSAVSDAQRHMVIGELGMAGRLNRHTFGHDLVDVIPIGIDPDMPPEHTKQVIRGVLCGDEDFVVLSSGGYNNWMDVDTLFGGVDRAMAGNPAIHYVSTGGAIRGHYEEGYERFCSLVEGSSYRDRYHLLGWVPYEEVASYYFEADVGINVDRPVYESEFGARNRFLTWIQAGLPIVTTLASEISWQMAGRDLAFGVPIGDPASLAQEILTLAEDRARAKESGERAKEYAHEHWTYEKTTLPLRAWARSPRFAPDHEKGAEPDPMDGLLDEFEARLYTCFEQGPKPGTPDGLADRMKKFLGR
jgi:glycosyltransferase involved in cell wall biosynthesis